MLVNVLVVLALGAGTAWAACGGVQQVKPRKDVNLGRAPIAIGDSSMLLALPKLANEGYRANARGCRQWSEGLDVMRKLKREDHLPRLVVVVLGADGVFTATLSTLLADLIPVTSALIGAGLLLAAQRLISVILSFVSGPLVDRFEASRLLVPCGLVIVAGLTAIAAGYVYAGAVVLIVARALFAIVSPVIAAQQSTDRIGAIASYATWSDCGLAAGAFIGIMGMEWAGYPATYAMLAAATLAAIMWFRWRQAVPPPAA